MPNSATEPAAICLMGPTASGKTELALEIAQLWPCEVISVDSALVYRDMNIGTAKPDAEFLARLPHHLIDIRNPDQPYSAAEFRKDALPLMEAITERGNIPLLVGGTMLYFKILLEGIADMPSSTVELREAILAQAQQHGWPALHDKLAQFDPVSAARIHSHHSQRISRALEVYYASGETLSSLQSRQQLQRPPYNFLQLALWPENRALLHQRIEKRFVRMLEQGFIEEVENLRQHYALHPDLPSMRAVGYRQVWRFLEGEIDRNSLIDQGVAATRQLAKRQLTWLRKWPQLHQLPLGNDENVDHAAVKKRILSSIRSLMAGIRL